MRPAARPVSSSTRPASDCELIPFLSIHSANRSTVEAESAMRTTVRIGSSLRGRPRPRFFAGTLFLTVLMNLIGTKNRQKQEKSDRSKKRGRRDGPPRTPETPRMPQRSTKGRSYKRKLMKLPRITINGPRLSRNLGKSTASLLLKEGPGIFCLLTLRGCRWLGAWGRTSWLLSSRSFGMGRGSVSRLKVLTSRPILTAWPSGLTVFRPGSSSPPSRLWLQDRPPAPIGSKAPKILINPVWLPVNSHYGICP
jgi:hypothetical protein